MSLFLYKQRRLSRRMRSPGFTLLPLKPHGLEAKNDLRQDHEHFTGSHFVSPLDQERRHWLLPAASPRPLWKGKLVVSLEAVHSIIPLGSCSCFPSGATGEGNHTKQKHTHGSGITLVAVHRAGDFNPAGPREFKPLKKNN